MADNSNVKISEIEKTKFSINSLKQKISFVENELNKMKFIKPMRKKSNIHSDTGAAKNIHEKVVKTIKIKTTHSSSKNYKDSITCIPQMMFENSNQIEEININDSCLESVSSSDEKNVEFIEGRVLNELQKEESNIKHSNFITTTPFITYGKKVNPGKVLEEIANQWFEKSERISEPLQNEEFYIKFNSSNKKMVQTLTNSNNNTKREKSKLKLGITKKYKKDSINELTPVRKSKHDRKTIIISEPVKKVPIPKDDLMELVERIELVETRIRPENGTELTRKIVQADNPKFYPGFCEHGDKKSELLLTTKAEPDSTRRKKVLISTITNKKDIISTTSWRMCSDGTLKKLKKKPELKDIEPEISPLKDCDLIREPISWRTIPRLKKKEPAIPEPRKEKKRFYNTEEVQEYIKKQHRERKRKWSEDKLLIENLRKRKEEALHGLMAIQRKKVLQTNRKENSKSSKLHLTRKISVHRTKNEKIHQRHSSYVIALTSNTSPVRRNKNIQTENQMFVIPSTETTNSAMQTTNCVIQTSNSAIQVDRRESSDNMVRSVQTLSTSNSNINNVTNSSTYSYSQRASDNKPLLNGFHCEISQQNAQKDWTKMKYKEQTVNTDRLTTYNDHLKKVGELASLIKTPANLYWNSNGKLPDPYSFMNVLKKKYGQTVSSDFSREMENTNLSTQNGESYEESIKLSNSTLGALELSQEISTSLKLGESDQNGQNTTNSYSSFPLESPIKPAMKAEFSPVISNFDEQSEANLKNLHSYCLKYQGANSNTDISENISEVESISKKSCNKSEQSISTDPGLKSISIKGNSSSSKNVLNIISSSSFVDGTISKMSQEKSSRNSSALQNNINSVSQLLENHKPVNTISTSIQVSNNLQSGTFRDSQSKLPNNPNYNGRVPESENFRKVSETCLEPESFRLQLQLGVSCLESLNILNDVQNLEMAILSQQKLREQQTLAQQLQFSLQEEEAGRQRFFQDMKNKHQEAISRSVGEVKDAIMESTLAILPLMRQQYSVPSYSVAQQTSTSVAQQTITSIAEQTSLINFKSSSEVIESHSLREDLESNESVTNSSETYQSDFEEAAASEISISSEIKSGEISEAASETVMHDNSSEIVTEDITSNAKSELKTESSKIETEMRTEDSISDIEEISGIQMPSVHSSSISSVVDELTIQKYKKSDSSEMTMEEVENRSKSATESIKSLNSSDKNGTEVNESSSENTSSKTLNNLSPSQSILRRSPSAGIVNESIKQTKVKMLSPLIPLKGTKKRRDYSTSEDDSTLSHNFIVITDQSDLEGRVLALRDQLKKRKSEAARLAREWKRRYRDTLKEKEISLQKQIKAYEEFIEDTKRNLEKELDSSNQSATSIKISKPKIVSRKTYLASKKLDKSEPKLSSVTPEELRPSKSEVIDEAFTGSDSEIPDDNDIDEVFSNDKSESVEESLKTLSVEEQSVESLTSKGDSSNKSVSSVKSKVSDDYDSPLEILENSDHLSVEGKSNDSFISEKSSIQSRNEASELISVPENSIAVVTDNEVENSNSSKEKSLTTLEDEANYTSPVLEEIEETKSITSALSGNKISDFIVDKQDSNDYGQNDSFESENVQNSTLADKTSSILVPSSGSIPSTHDSNSEVQQKQQNESSDIQVASLKEFPDETGVLSRKEESKQNSHELNEVQNQIESSNGDFVAQSVLTEDDVSSISEIPEVQSSSASDDSKHNHSKEKSDNDVSTTERKLQTNEVLPHSPENTSIIRDNSTQEKEPKEIVSVESNEIVSVESNEIASVESNEIASVESNEIASVESNEIASVESNEIASVESNEIVSVESNEIVSVESNEIVSVESNEIVSTEPNAVVSQELSKTQEHEKNFSEKILHTLLQQQVDHCLQILTNKNKKLINANQTTSQCTVSKTENLDCQKLITEEPTLTKKTDTVTNTIFSNLVEDTVHCLKSLENSHVTVTSPSILDVSQRVSDILLCLKKDNSKSPPSKHRPQDLMILSPIEDDQDMLDKNTLVEGVVTIDPVTEIQTESEVEWFEEDFGLKSPKGDSNSASYSGNYQYYYRQIPDKPPPPYTPPQGAMLEKLAKLGKPLPPPWNIPNSEKEVDKLLVSSAAQLYNGLYLNNVPLDDLQPDEKYFEMEARFDEITAKSERAYRLLIFDLCKAAVVQLQKSTNELKNQEPWKKIRRTVRNPVIPNSKEEFVSTIQKIAKTALESRIRSGLATKFKHKKHDFVDALLLQDMAEEEAEWVNYEEDEVTVKLFVADSIFAQLVDDVVAFIRNKS